jgi:hypothetical protein
LLCRIRANRITSHRGKTAAFYRVELHSAPQLRAAALVQRRPTERGHGVIIAGGRQPAHERILAWLGR